jgi:transposase
LGIRRGKSDPIDAARIADYAMRFIDKVELWTPPRKIIQDLKVLLTIRNRMIKCKKELSVPINEMESFSSAYTYEQVEKLSSKPIKAMEASLKQIEDQIEELIKSDPEIKESYTRLTSIKGVGKVIAL